MFHSDRGAQYTSKEFDTFCENNFVYQSKGRVATCYDNAVAESFFASLKVEFYYQQAHPGGLGTTHEIARWITFYNTTRFHSAINYLPPEREWERGSAVGLVDTWLASRVWGKGKDVDYAEVVF